MSSPMLIASIVPPFLRHAGQPGPNTNYRREEEVRRLHGDYCFSKPYKYRWPVRITKEGSMSVPLLPFSLEAFRFKVISDVLIVILIASLGGP